MAIAIKHIDKIAREKQRDVLFVEFYKTVFSTRNYEKYEERTNLIKWLDENKIGYELCAHIANDNVMRAYRGQIYIDLVYDESDEKYILLNEYLENPDGTPKMPGVMFYNLTLEQANKNLHHDEPGFWEEWAENF